MYCPKCGDIYRRVVWNNRGKQSIVWRCCARMEHGPGTCNADAIRESELQKELLKVANAKGNYDSIVNEIYSLREAKQNVQVESAEREGMKKRISEMQQFLAEQQQDITEYDEQLVRRLIEKITVYDERVTVEFKSGTSVDVRR